MSQTASSQIKLSRKPNRLKNYDYSQHGWYFITICTQNRIEWFGKIKNGKMFLGELGKIVMQQWLWLAQQYNYVILDKYVVMPNHLHGIMAINNNNHVVGTGRDLSLQRNGKTTKIKSLSELMGAFKTTSSKLIHQHGQENFKWQRSFYDHIIRNEKSLNQIRQYIINNPLKWDSDRNNLNYLKQ